MTSAPHTTSQPLVTSCTSNEAYAATPERVRRDSAFTAPCHIHGHAQCSPSSLLLLSSTKTRSVRCSRHEDSDEDSEAATPRRCRPDGADDEVRRDDELLSQTEPQAAAGVITPCVASTPAVVDNMLHGEVAHSAVTRVLNVSHPVVHFLSTLQLQGYVERIVGECGMERMDDLMHAVQSEDDAARLLGPYAALAHKRELMRGLQRWAREAQRRHQQQQRRQQQRQQMAKAEKNNSKKWKTSTKKGGRRKETEAQTRAVEQTEQQQHTEDETIVRAEKRHDANTTDHLCDTLLFASVAAETCEGDQAAPSPHLCLPSAITSTCGALQSASATQFMRSLAYRGDRNRRRRTDAGKTYSETRNNAVQAEMDSALAAVVAEVSRLSNAQPARCSKSQPTAATATKHEVVDVDEDDEDDGEVEALCEGAPRKPVPPEEAHAPCGQRADNAVACDHFTNVMHDVVPSRGMSSDLSSFLHSVEAAGQSRDGTQRTTQLIVQHHTSIPLRTLALDASLPTQSLAKTPVEPPKEHFVSDSVDEGVGSDKEEAVRPCDQMQSLDRSESDIRRMTTGQPLDDDVTVLQRAIAELVSRYNHTILHAQATTAEVTPQQRRLPLRAVLCPWPSDTLPGSTDVTACCTLTNKPVAWPSAVEDRGKSNNSEADVPADAVHETWWQSYGLDAMPAAAAENEACPADATPRLVDTADDAAFDDDVRRSSRSSVSPPPCSPIVNTVRARSPSSSSTSSSSSAAVCVRHVRFCDEKAEQDHVQAANDSEDATERALTRLMESYDADRGLTRLPAEALHAWCDRFGLKTQPAVKANAERCEDTTLFVAPQECDVAAKNRQTHDDNNTTTVLPYTTHSGNKGSDEDVTAAALLLFAQPDLCDVTDEVTQSSLLQRDDGTSWQAGIDDDDDGVVGSTKEHALPPWPRAQLPSYAAELKTDYLRAQVQLMAVRAIFQRRVVPALLHRVENISHLPYKRPRAAALMDCGEVRLQQTSRDETSSISTPVVDTVQCRRRARQAEQREADRCVVAALAADTVTRQLHRAHTVPRRTTSGTTSYIVNDNGTATAASASSPPPSAASALSLTPYEQLLLLEPASVETVTALVQRHFATVTHGRVQRLFARSDIPAAVPPTRSTSPVGVHEADAPCESAPQSPLSCPVRADDAMSELPASGGAAVPLTQGQRWRERTRAYFARRGLPTRRGVLARRRY